MNLTKPAMLTKEYVQKTFKRATWYDKHGDRSPSDFGPPAKLYYTDYKKITPEEEEAYYEKLDEIALDNITW